ncbi:protein of unknown function [Azospirillum baldaniorum]|uniref:Uncharacterized protein n=1 Tax=Azospirillum baldaniorum TaxID=1064539 RepID=A0A9P1NMH7_9PROT|nr:protein of unknown function [Azospirillum baldaniorum]
MGAEKGIEKPRRSIGNHKSARTIRPHSLLQMPIQ